MGLLDDLNDREKLTALKPAKCTVCMLLKALDQKESAKLAEVIDDPSVAKTSLARVLQDNGYKVTSGTISRHARKECLRA